MISMPRRTPRCYVFCTLLAALVGLAGAIPDADAKTQSVANQKAAKRRAARASADDRRSAPPSMSEAELRARRLRAKALGQRPMPVNPELAMRWRSLSLVDEEGSIAAGARTRAILQRDENLTAARQKGADKVAGLEPSSWTSLGPRNVGGRTRALVIHPANPLVMWAGAVGGGVWKTTNGGASWEPLDDFLENLAVGALALDPQNPDVLYCGTGEGYFNGDALQGAGIFKSIDGGGTWSQLPATESWYYVNRISVAPNNGNVILAAALGGIYRSTDGGTTWTNVRAADRAYVVAFHPTDSTRAVASTIAYDGNARTWYHAALSSSDGGTSWTAASGPLGRVEGFFGRIEVAFAPSASSIVYASLASTGTIWRSDNGGVSFARQTASGQSGSSWYANPLWVSPTNPDVLVTGGYHLYRSVDGGRTLTQISDGYLLTQQAHPDQHLVVHHPGFDGVSNLRVFACNDGGVFATDNVLTVNPAFGWRSLVNGYQTTQYYGVAGAGDVVVGGTQDNGTLLSRAGSTTAGLTFGGDGGFSAIDPQDTRYLYGEYVFLAIHRSTDGGASAQYIYDGIADADSGNPRANFIAPFVLDPNDSNSMLAGGASLWRSANVKTASVPSWRAIRPPGSSLISAISVAPGDSNTIWVAQNDGRVAKTSNGLAPSPSWTDVDNNGTRNPLPARYPTRLLVDPADSDRVYVSFGGFTDGNLYRTDDGGQTWGDVSGQGADGLPFAPIRGVARHPANGNLLYVGTEVGVFQSENGGATWTASNVGPANVSVDEIVFKQGTTTLIAGTHGRGVWSAELPACPPARLAHGLTLSDALSTFDCRSDARPASYRDTYLFEAEAGRTYIVELESADFDGWLAIAEASGTVLAEDDNSGGGTAAKIVFEAPADGTFTIEATSAAAEAVGRYAISLEEEYRGPEAPTGLAASKVKKKKVALAWTDASTDEDSFDLLQWDGTAWGVLRTLPAGTVSATVTSLRRRTTYRFGVRSCRGGTCSAVAETTVTTR
jgi:photosystem II stability/assembly factor-like uncharacterized protein